MNWTRNVWFKKKYVLKFRNSKVFISDKISNKKNIITCVWYTWNISGHILPLYPLYILPFVYLIIVYSNYDLTKSSIEIDGLRKYIMIATNRTCFKINMFKISKRQIEFDYYCPSNFKYPFRHQCKNIHTFTCYLKFENYIYNIIKLTFEKLKHEILHIYFNHFNAPATIP